MVLIRDHILFPAISFLFRLQVIWYLPPPPMSLVARGITRRLTGPSPTTFFEDLDLSVSPGEVLFVLGPSGSGKTQLLRALAGLDELQGGEVHLLLPHPPGPAALDASTKGPAFRAEVSLVQQSRAPLPGAPADLLAAALGFASQRARRPAGAVKAVPLQEDLDLLERLLASVGLPPSAAGQTWATLSGGESQRAGLAVALALRPAVLLLDEPTSACDPDSARLVEAAVRASGAAAVWVTHDPAQAERVGGARLLFPLTGRGGANASAAV